jgi:DNA uptake protein ComE-like DNA-binding protein
VRILPGLMMLMLVAAGAPGAIFCSTSAPAALPAQHAPPPEMRIDINHASIEELISIPGLTRTWAGRIVRFRPYHTKLELLDQGVVSSEMYNRIKDYIIAHREKP